MKKQMGDLSTLSGRMKAYEKNPIVGDSLNFYDPIIMRLDGCHFHSFTRGLKKPFDRVLTESMANTTKHLCNSIQGCTLGYTQSDEISLLIDPISKTHTESWFGLKVQKMCSVAASTASVKFNMEFCRIAKELLDNGNITDAQYDFYTNKLGTAIMDCRVFNIPRHEVENVFVWRQQDAVRNSIQATAQSLYSHKDIDKKNQSDLLKMMHETGFIWDKEIPEENQRGIFVYKIEKEISTENGPCIRKKFIFDMAPPMVEDKKEYVREHLAMSVIEFMTDEELYEKSLYSLTAAKINDMLLDKKNKMSNQQNKVPLGMWCIDVNGEKVPIVVYIDWTYYVFNKKDTDDFIERMTKEVIDNRNNIEKKEIYKD